MNNNLIIKDYCCYHEFVDKVMDDFLNHVNNNTYSIDIIVDGELTQDLIRSFMSIPMEYNSFMFTCGMIDFDSIEYNKEYILTIDNNFEIWCEPAYHDNEYGKGYIHTEADKIYVQDEVNQKIMDTIKSNDIVIFGFKKETQFDY